MAEYRHAAVSLLEKGGGVWDFTSDCPVNVRVKYSINSMISPPASLDETDRSSRSSEASSLPLSCFPGSVGIFV